VLKLKTSSATGSFSINYMNENWMPKLEQVTYGTLKVDICPSKSVVPHRETPQADPAGILQGDLNAVAYFAGRDPVFGIMGDLTPGYDIPEQKQMFFRFGGGKEILQKAYDKHYCGSIHVVGAGPFAKEAFVSTTPCRCSQATCAAAWRCRPIS
jgi:TRAP-type mannitol/chloroaromatic compound transport system substrate-binding protein